MPDYSSHTQNKTDADRAHPRIKTFGRRDARKLSRRQTDLVENLLPTIEIKTDEATTPVWADFAPDVTARWLEIGFGGGEHVAAQAKQNAKTGILAAEPFIDGVAKLLTEIEEQALPNVRILPDDVRPLLWALEDASIDRVFILFPDPWPKRRQQKRRLVQDDVVEQLARIMKPGASLRFATDVKSYADEALWRFLSHEAFEWHAESADDWRCIPEDHFRTRYEAKRLGDCEPVWFDFCRT